MTAALFHRKTYGLQGLPVSAMRADHQVPCIVTLIDRRTGLAHRGNGSPLTLYTLHPEAAATDLLAGRDAAVWEARIERLGKVATA